MSFGDNFGQPNVRPENETDLAPEQTQDADAELEAQTNAAKRAYSIEMASANKHLYNTVDEFFDLVNRIEEYLK